MAKLTDKQRKEIIKLYKDGIGPEEIGKLYNIYDTSVNRIVRKAGITPHLRRLTDEENVLIIEKYKSGISSEIIANEFNINGSTVCRLLKRSGVEIRDGKDNKRKYTIDEKWLDNIDSENKSYFLGLMFSDGNVNSKSAAITIALNDVDRDILEKLSVILYGFIKLEKYKTSTNLGLYSKILKERLIKIGCVPNKTFVVKYPDIISKELHKHFIRGLIDGDGCVYIQKDKKRYLIDYTGTIELIDGMIEVIKNELGITDFVKYKRHKDKKDNIWSFRITKPDDVVKFLNWIYEGATLYLNRKYQYYLEILDLHKIRLEKKIYNISEDEKEKIINDIRQNISIKDICEKYNRGVRTIFRIKSELKI